MRARWTLQMEKALLDTLLSEADKARMTGIAFKKESWENTIQAVNALLPTGVAMSKQQVKNKVHNMKKKYEIVARLKSNSDFGWDEEKNLPTASDEVWEAYNETHPEAAEFRTTPLMHWDRLHAFFSGSPLSGGISPRGTPLARKSLVPSLSPEIGSDSGLSPGATTGGEPHDVQMSDAETSLKFTPTEILSGHDSADQKPSVQPQHQHQQLQPALSFPPIQTPIIQSRKPSTTRRPNVSTNSTPSTIPRVRGPSNSNNNTNSHLVDPYPSGSMAIAKALEGISRSTKDVHSSVIRTAVNILCKEYTNSLDTDTLVNAALLLENETKANVFLGLSSTPAVRDAWLARQL